MTRDYVNYTRRRNRQTRRGFLIFIVLTFAALLPGLFFYIHRQNLTVAGFKEKTAEKFAAYFPNLDHPPKAALAKKTLSAESENPKPVHFNFYDELPKAQLDSQKGEALQKGSVEEGPSEEKPSVAPLVKKSQLAPIAPQKPQINEREESLAQEFAKDLSSLKTPPPFPSSILEISVFHSLDAAKRYRAALTSAGLKIDLVTLRIGKTVIYRLQQGPYHQLEQLKLAKKRLNERGIACEIRKLPP